MVTLFILESIACFVFSNEKFLILRKLKYILNDAAKLIATGLKYVSRQMKNDRKKHKKLFHFTIIFTFSTLFIGFSLSVIVFTTVFPDMNEFGMLITVINDTAV